MTIRFYYDVEDHLIVMESSDQRWYVGTDESGSPRVVFNVHGTVVKTIDRTPFGELVEDSLPLLYIAVDFQGGIFNPHTGFIHYGNRVYDPHIKQWLTPQWEHLVTRLEKPQDIFIYRFRNNDPISVDNQQRYMTGEFAECNYHFKNSELDYFLTAVSICDTSNNENLYFYLVDNLKKLHLVQINSFTQNHRYII